MLLGRREEGLQAVVVALADRVELVIVAARAAERHARGTPTPTMLVISVSTSLRLLATSWLPAFLRTGPRRLKPDGDQRLVFRRRDLVAGELLGEEAVERLVVVETRGSRSRDSARRPGDGVSYSKPSVSAKRTTSSQCWPQRSP